LVGALKIADDILGIKARLKIKVLIKVLVINLPTLT
jgi:hypothetical protein